MLYDGFEVPLAVTVKIVVCQDVTPCSAVNAPTLRRYLLPM